MLHLTNARIVLPDRVLERGTVVIAEGQIAEIREGDAPRGERAVDCAGLLLLPGLIDMHGDMLEIEAEPRPGAQFPVELAVYELDKRLAGCGVTTAYAALSFWDAGDSRKHRGLERMQELGAALDGLRETLLVDLRLHARYEVPTPQVRAALEPLLAAGQVQLLSLMDHTPGQGQYRNLEQWVNFAVAWGKGDPAKITAETEERMRRVREDTSLWEQARELVQIANALGVPVASHDDDTYAKVDAMAALGVAISEFPVTLEAADEARRRGMAVAMGAPNALRGTSHSGNLSASEAISAGVVDILAADYAPATLLHAVFALERRGVLALPEAARLVTANVADALGLRDRGRIAAGQRADLTLVEAGALPRVRGTIRGGTPIYWDSQMWGRG